MKCGQIGKTVFANINPGAGFESGIRGENVANLLVVMFLDGFER